MMHLYRYIKNAKRTWLWRDEKTSSCSSSRVDPNPPTKIPNILLDRDLSGWENVYTNCTEDLLSNVYVECIWRIL